VSAAIFSIGSLRFIPRTEKVDDERKEVPVVRVELGQGTFTTLDWGEVYSLRDALTRWLEDR
jgi:hypothetical protein